MKTKNKLDIFEEFLLKFFRIAMLCLTALALISTIFFGIASAYQAMQVPASVAPPKITPQKDISIDDLKKFIQEQNKGKDDPVNIPENIQGVAPSSLKYLEETTKLYRCTTDFAKLIGAVIEYEGDTITAQKVEGLRAQIEQFASLEGRADLWVKSLVPFTCSVLNDKQIASWAKNEKYKIFVPTLNFHMMTWDANVNQKNEADQKEKQRFEMESNAEKLRFERTKEQSQSLLIMAGVVFGAFMVLAFYLLFSKIERNLRSHVVGDD